jgi:hypothetical protein
VVFNALIFTKLTTALQYYPGDLLYWISLKSGNKYGKYE